MPSATPERDLGEAGLNDALERLRQRIEDPAAGNPIVSLAETLEWCYTLEEHHVKRLGRAAFEQQRAASA